MRNPIRWSLALVVGLGVTAAVAHARADEEKVALKDVPPAVVKAVKAKFPGAAIKQAEKEEEDGETIYELGITHDGHSIDVSATADGKIVSVETQVKEADLPGAVSKAIKARYPKGKVEKAEVVEEDGKTTYEVIVELADDKDVEVVLDQSGKILKVEEDKEAEEKEAKEEEKEEKVVALDKVPPAVVKAVKAKFPGAAIKQAEKEEEDGETIYELGITHKGQDIDVSAKADGKIISVEKEIKEGDLPAAVSKTIKARYPRGKIEKAELVTEIEEEDETTYEVVIVRASGKKVELVLDPAGKVLETEEDNDD